MIDTNGSIATARLLLRAPLEADAPAIANYMLENREYHARWTRAWTNELGSADHWAEWARQAADDLAHDRAVRFLVFLAGDPSDLLGTINFTQIIRGAAQYCVLGYSLTERHEGNGYMTEALRAAIRYMFGPMNLHRIMANYMPENQRSGQVLQRLGFRIEGMAQNYLYLNGAWRDHVLTSLTNPEWRAKE